MLIKDVVAQEPILAIDNTQLREIIHPARDPVGIRYSLAHAIIGPGETSLRHRLVSSEVYYILYGWGVMHVGDEAATVHPGQAIYVPGGAVQWIENSGATDLAFLCIVDPAWRDEDEELIR
jgi:mannose-6-phosphate isomerase-like protein (cupin superfamily)